MLELAVLGLLHEAPLHGYELRQRLKATLGTFRAFSYGSLYPTLRRMKDAGWIAEDEGDAQVVAGAPPLTGRRGKVVYKLTADGKERFTELLAEAGPSAWEDETFGVHFAFFSQTDPEVRVRILEGRRSRLEERREGVRSGLARTRGRLDFVYGDVHTVNAARDSAEPYVFEYQVHVENYRLVVDEVVSYAGERTHDSEWLKNNKR